MRYLVEGRYAGRAAATYEVHAESSEAAHQIAEAAGVLVTAVIPETTSPTHPIISVNPAARTAGRAAFLVLGGLVSGFLSASLGFVFLPTLWVVPGVLFAVFVAGPWGWMCGWGWGRVAPLVVLCTAGYTVAHLCAAISHFVASPLGAAVGTGIMLIPAFTDRDASVRWAALRAVAVGTLTAFVFTAFSFVPQGWAGLLLGLVIWQVAVAGVLSTGVPPPAPSPPA